MSGKVGLGILRLITEYEPGIASAEPAAVSRVTTDLAISLAGVLAGVVIHQGESTARFVTADFAKKVDDNVTDIIGKTMNLLREANHIN